MRIIQDSDDDDVDADLEPRTRSPNVENVSPQASELAPATSSTGSLKKTIAAVHHDLIEANSTQSNKNPVSKQSNGNLSISPLFHSNKRRKTVGILPSQGPERLGRYGLEGSETYAPLHVHGVGGVRDFNRSPSCGHLPTAIEAGYAEQDPTSLFLNLSSTIPYNTPSQQRLLDEVLSPTFLDAVGLNAPDADPDKSSIPWSDFLMSSPEAYPKCPKHAGVTPAGSLAPSLGLNEPEQLRQSYSSITHTCAQPITGYSNNSGETESQRACDDDIQLVGDRHLPTSVASIQTSPQPAAAANSSQTKPRRVSSSYEECGPLKYERASNVVISITPKRESSNFGLHNLSEDTVGLPKEQYKPPPSRSRSAKPPVDLTIDYSVRPEQKAKTKAKRNRTIAVSEKPSTPTASSLLLRSQSQMTVTEESTEVLPLEGALPLKSEITSGKSTAASLDHWYTPEKSDRTNAQQMKNTEEVTITIPEEPLANMEKTEGESRPREHANDNITASKRKENSDVIGIDNFQKTEDGGKLLNGTRRKVQRSKTLGFLDSLQKEVLAAPETPKGKKRGRGRLQKSQEVPMTEPGDEVVSTNPSSTAVIQSGVSTQAKASRDTPSHTVTSMTEENPVVRPNSTPPKPDNPAQRTRPAMGDTPEKRSHSPLSKGKVPFRVGLSRRARIAPLLRIVKK